jgi:hypothetical protein
LSLKGLVDISRSAPQACDDDQQCEDGSVAGDGNAGAERDANADGRSALRATPKHAPTPPKPMAAGMAPPSVSTGMMPQATRKIHAQGGIGPGLGFSAGVGFID